MTNVGHLGKEISNETFMIYDTWELLKFPNAIMDINQKANLQWNKSERGVSGTGDIWTNAQDDVRWTIYEATEKGDKSSHPSSTQSE